MCVLVKLLWLCLTLCDPMDCNPPGSSAHGILQARILEWVAMPSSKRSNLGLFMSPALAGGFFTSSTTWEAQDTYICRYILSTHNIKTYLMFLICKGKSCFHQRQKITISPSLPLSLSSLPPLSLPPLLCLHLASCLPSSSFMDLQKMKWHLSNPTAIVHMKARWHIYESFIRMVLGLYGDLCH